MERVNQKIPITNCCSSTRSRKRKRNLVEKQTFDPREMQTMREEEEREDEESEVDSEDSNEKMEEQDNGMNKVNSEHITNIEPTTCLKNNVSKMDSSPDHVPVTSSQLPSSQPAVYVPVNRTPAIQVSTCIHVFLYYLFIQYGVLLHVSCVC